jgi:ATP/maltotriose-dependent transcriptional regulator MalT
MSPTGLPPPLARHTAPVATTLFGRAEILAKLNDALAATASGVSRCVVIEGPPGIGKSAVLAAACHTAVAHKISVAYGAAMEMDHAAPLSTLLTALHSNPELNSAIANSSDLPNNALLLVERIGELIEDHVKQRSLLIVIDDAHWADELSALALRILIPALSLSPVMWLLARRPAPMGEPSHEAIEWLISKGAGLAEITPLDDASIAQLCTKVLGAPPDSSVLALAARGGGNPFIVQELMVALRDADHVSVKDGLAMVVTDELPAGFLDAVDRRLRHMSAEARQLLDAGAIMGRPFKVHEAAALMGRPAIELIPAAKEAVEAGTLVERETELAFRHDLIGEAVYDRLSGPVRLALHREAALVARNERRSPLEVAEHLIKSGQVGDEEARAVLRDVIDTIAPTAPGTAGALLQRMLGFLDPFDSSRPELSARAVRLLATAGRVNEARQLGEQALNAGLDGASEASLILGLSEALKHAGQNRAVTEWTERALHTPGVPDYIRAQLLAIGAHGLLSSDDIDAADRAGAQAVKLGEATGQHSAVVFGLVARSAVARMRGHIDVAVSHAHDAVAIADSQGTEAAQRHPRLWLGRALAGVDRFAEAEAVYELGERRSKQLGTAWSQPLWHFYRGELRMAAGRLDDAAAEAEAGVRVAEQLNALALDVPLNTLLAQIAILRGDLVTARARLERAEALIRTGISVGLEEFEWRVALLQAASRDHVAAFQTLHPIFACFPARLQLLVQERSAAAQLVRMAKRAGAMDKAEMAVDAANELAERTKGVPSLHAAARHAYGLLHDDLHALREAAEHYRTGPRLLGRAEALEDAAVAEDAAGHRSSAVTMLNEVLDLYNSCGAERSASRVYRMLRRRGVRRARGSNKSFGGLTESELRVVRLVAQGLTNREVATKLFLSPHTVDSHLRHSFTKLRVNSRVELTRYVIKHHGDIEDHAST